MHSKKVPYFILDLLQQVPSVYVMGLGRFDAIFHPAVIDLPRAQIKPPYVEPDFNEDPESLSGILSAYMHYVTGVDLEEANEAIQDFVKEIQIRTLNESSYRIEKFGTFSRSSQGNIRFTPDWDAFNLSFSGLEVLDLNARIESTPVIYPVTTKPPVVVSQPISIDTPTETVRDRDYVLEDTSQIIAEPKLDEVVSDHERIDESTSRLWWFILSSALILITILCGYLAWDILSNRHKLNDLKQIYPDTSSILPPGLTSPSDTSSPAVDGTPITEPSPTEDTIEEGGISEEPVSYCYIVVGAFSNPDNVARMVERINSMGYTSEQIKGGALTRVAIRTACDKANLQKILDEARSTVNPEAWIY